MLCSTFFFFVLILHLGQMFDDLFLSDLNKASQQELSEKTRESVQGARFDF